MKLVFKNVILLLIIYFLARYLIENWNKIDESKYPVDWLYFSLSLISILCALFFLPLAFGKIVALFKYRLALKKMGTLLFYSQIAKYLPGGIWGYLGRVYLYKKEGMNVSDASTCVFLETLITVISGLFVFFICMFFIDKIPSIGWMNKTYIVSAGIFTMLCLLFILHPRILNWAWKLIPARIQTSALQFDYGYFSILKPTAILIFFWLGVAIGFWLLIKSFYFVDFNLLPMTTGAYIAAWIIGLAVFFTPGGLGVREASLVLLLSLYLPVHIAAFIAVVARIWWVIGELIWAFFFFVLNRFQAKI